MQAGKGPLRDAVKRGDDVVMKQPSNIPLVRVTNGDVLPGNPFTRIVFSSADRNRSNLVVEEHHLPSRQCEMDNSFMYVRHVISLNLGGRITSEVKVAIFIDTANLYTNGTSEK
jgi:hypothetical protein